MATPYPAWRQACERRARHAAMPDHRTGATPTSRPITHWQAAAQAARYLRYPAAPACRQYVLATLSSASTRGNAALHPANARYKRRQTGSDHNPVYRVDKAVRQNPLSPGCNQPGVYSVYSARRDATAAAQLPGAPATLLPRASEPGYA